MPQHHFSDRKEFLCVYILDRSNDKSQTVSLWQTYLTDLQKIITCTFWAGDFFFQMEYAITEVLHLLTDNFFLHEHVSCLLAYAMYHHRETIKSNQHYVMEQ